MFHAKTRRVTGNFDKRVVATVVGAEAAGEAVQRLDRWLAGRFTYRSRNQWQGCVERGIITVNGHVARSSRTLHPGDTVEFIIDEFDEPEVDFGYRILWQDEQLVAVDKPGKLPCHPAGPFFRNTLWHKLSTDLGQELFIVNRLDRETSGVTLFAKSEEMAGRMSGLFATGAVEKEYLAIVHGVFPEAVDADGYLLGDDASPVRKKRRFVLKDEAVRSGASRRAEAERAATFLQRVAADAAMSVVRAVPKTGRTHQIRATLCSLGFPVVGDKIYGVDDSVYLRFIDDGMTMDDIGKMLLPRQALHSGSLAFAHPSTGARVEISSPLPEDMAWLAEKIAQSAF